MAERCGGCIAAACHWFIAKYEIPFRPIFPVLHGCPAAHSIQAQRSTASRRDQTSRNPGERPAPRESTRTQTYPSGTHFSGSTSSQFWYRLLEPSSTSGAALTSLAQLAL